MIIRALEAFAGISSPFLSLPCGAHLGEVVWLLTASPLIMDRSKDA
tara:strand:+ start:617 stop:754 length:138 start_codon:yes stop_codon:yes gene_type:complete